MSDSNSTPTEAAPKRKRSTSPATKKSTPAVTAATTKSTRAKSAASPSAVSKPPTKRTASSGATAKRKPATSTKQSSSSRRPFWQRLISRLLFSFYWLIYQLALRFWMLSTRGKIGVGLALILIGVLLYAITRPPPSRIASFFMPSVQYWGSDITRWSQQYDVDPNLIATLMQIESCGLPGAESHAGAQGLFQVMPFHFSEDEKNRMIEPEINAKRGMGVIIDCLERADNDFGLAMACYNGGPGQLARPQDQWPNETQRYYVWGSGIYREAKSGSAQSPTLQAWLQAGGASLCRQAEAALNIQPPTAIPSDFTPDPLRPGALPTFGG